MIRRFRTPVPVSVLTQSGPDFLGLDQNCIQVQITGCHKEITQRLILIKVECIYSVIITMETNPVFSNNITKEQHV